VTLSIVAAAADAGDAPAIITATRALTFAECAGAVPPSRTLVATPNIDTLLAIYAALEAQHPLALLHAKHVEVARESALVAAAALPDDTAFVLFTSGSTGPARGVVLSRAAIVAATTASRLGWRAGDRWLCCLPLAHAGGLSIVVRCLAARTPVVLLDGDFDPDRVLALACDARATLLSLVPAQLAALADRAAPPALRAVLLGGAAAAPSLVARAVAAGWPVLPTYGLTETFGQVATATEPGGPPIVLPGVTITAADTLRIRGPMLATAYLDGEAIAPELVTADVGTLAGDALHVRGRRDDVIITGGENVHPVEVEAVLAATPGVRAACVFGVPDARWGQLVAAAIVADRELDLDAARARWHAQLPAHARPRRLAHVAELPHTPSGKIDRRRAAELATTALEYR
jgi:O-succinylbenzoic acid--CoA ligase